MINLIALKDASLRQLYELKATSTPPSTLTEAVTIIQGILRSRIRAEELDQVNSSASEPLPVLAAKTETKPDLTAALLALIAKLAPADPDKPIADKPKRGSKEKGKGKDNDKKVNVPRNKDGKVLRWVEGMDSCKCGGKHLYRDCTDPRYALPEKKAARPSNSKTLSPQAVKFKTAEHIKVPAAGSAPSRPTPLRVSARGCARNSRPAHRAARPRPHTRWLALARWRRAHPSRAAAHAHTLSSHCTTLQMSSMLRDVTSSKANYVLGEPPIKSTKNDKMAADWLIELAAEPEERRNSSHAAASGGRGARADRHGAAVHGCGLRGGEACAGCEREQTEEGKGQPVYYPVKRAKTTNADGGGRSAVTARGADGGSGRGKVPLAQTVVVGKVYIQRMERKGMERRDAGRPPREPG